jgi:hypothetical protein
MQYIGTTIEGPKKSFHNVCGVSKEAEFNIDFKNINLY